jgi:hypothetical protein
MRAVFSERNFEVRETLLLGDEERWTVRVGLSMVLFRDDVSKVAGATVAIAGGALAGAMFIALLFSQWLLRPIHVLRAGLSRLGRGEQGSHSTCRPATSLPASASRSRRSARRWPPRANAADPVSTDTRWSSASRRRRHRCAVRRDHVANGAMRRILRACRSTTIRCGAGRSTGAVVAREQHADDARRRWQ